MHIQGKTQLVYGVIPSSHSSDLPDVVDNTTVVSTFLSLLFINLTWSPPAENNSPITMYTVTYCSNRYDYCYTEMCTVPHVLLDVTSNTRYTLNITATNEVGTSDASEQIVIFGVTKSECCRSGVL